MDLNHDIPYFFPSGFDKNDLSKNNCICFFVYILAKCSDFHSRKCQKLSKKYIHPQTSKIISNTQPQYLTTATHLRRRLAPWRVDIYKTLLLPLTCNIEISIMEIFRKFSENIICFMSFQGLVQDWFNSGLRLPTGHWSPIFRPGFSPNNISVLA